ncbi:CDP-alcohol phosphatidyltransferase family protein [Candidatus Woesearchaeota archaeon]|nr:CDP-alcohol phosphatidyltransferase family protein [Candidatus Woesearchaeota archaeon]
MVSFKQYKNIVQPPTVSWMGYRYISPYISWVLVHTPITANQVSAFWASLVIVSSVLIFFNNYLLGGFLFGLAAILDYVDGEIARYNKTKSLKWGEFFDWISTWLSYLLPLSALTFSIFLTTESKLFLFFGVFSIFGYSMVELVRLEDVKIHPEKAFRKDVAKIPFKKKLVRSYKNLFLIPYFHNVFFLFAIIDSFVLSGFMKYFLLYYFIGFNLLWGLKVLYELFFGFKDEKNSK